MSNDYARMCDYRDEAARQQAAKDDAYTERNHLVAALAHLFPSGIRATNIPGTPTAIIDNALAALLERGKGDLG